LDIGSLGGIVSLQQGKTASSLQTDVTRLSTGLRINSGADDPSGLAISQSLQSRVNGLDQGVSSVQTATNALTVADGALATIETLLQRVRTLVVGANSTLESSDDISDNQAEITTLIQEIDKISNTTQFNGKTLLDGSLSSDYADPAPQLLIPTNSEVASGDTVVSTLAGYSPEVDVGAEQFVQQITVDSYDATTGQLTVGGTIESTDPNFGPAQPFTFQVQAGTNYPTFAFGPPSPGFSQLQQYDQNSNQVLGFNIATLNPQDVGATSIILSIDGKTKAAGQNAQINDGSAEGTLVFIDIPAVNAQNLGVNEITLSTTGDSLINIAAEYRVDYGLSQIATIRAQVGAQVVALQGDVQSTQNTAVQLQSSESNIADLDVGQAVTQLTLDQIRGSIQTAVLSKLYSQAPAVLALVQGNLTNPDAATGGTQA
jgi:flagellin